MGRPGLQPPVAPRLGLWDAVNIIIGIVVGTAIFKSPMMVFQNVSGPWQALAAWLAGGLLSFCGAMCYAELATTYPRNGGDYEYLNLAYGRWLGFLFGWAQLTVILSASIGTMAYAFADYGVAIWPSLRESSVWLAVAAVVGLSALNGLGVVAGKSAQNVLSIVKVFGLAIVSFAGLWLSSATPAAPSADPTPFAPSFGLAMVFILYSYGGWNDAVFVAAEVRDQRRNLPRALFVGILSITAIYLAVNAAYLAVLGLDAARQSPTPAADVLQHSLGNGGRAAISVLVMISALGAINGMILTSSRVYATLGADYPVFAWLASWNQRTGAPLASIAIQAIAAVLLILSVGTAAGRAVVDASLGAVGAPGLPWNEYFGGFETLLAGSAPIFWSFFLLTGIAVFLLRRKHPAVQRPFSVPLYPLPLLVFCVTSLYMLYSSVVYARWLVLVVAMPLVLGAGLWFVIRGPQNDN
jgi:amino acid transporter